MRSAVHERTVSDGGRPSSAYCCATSLEWYDFVIYGLLAVYLAGAFFPQQSDTVALLATLAVFGVSFVMRRSGADTGWLR